MNAGSFIADAIVLLVLVMTVYGGILAVPPKQKQWSHMHRWAFVFFGVCALILSVWQNHQTDKEKDQLKAQISELQKGVKAVQETTTSTKESIDGQRTQAERSAGQRQKIRVQLARFMAEGRTLRNECEINPLSPSFLSAWKRWEWRVSIYLRDEVGTAYAARFVSAKIPGVIPIQNIQSELAALDKTVDDFKD